MNERWGRFDIFFVDGSSIEVYGNLDNVGNGRLYRKPRGEAIIELNFDNVLYIIKQEREAR